MAAAKAEVARKSVGRKPVGVQVPPPAPIFNGISMRVILGLLFFTFFATAISARAETSVKEYKEIFGSRDGCFVISRISDGKVLDEYNPQRCSEPFPPCSTFKPVMALIDFEKGVLENENTIIKWDGIKHDREVLNQDQTSYTWMEYSANWVNDWSLARLGREAVQSMLVDLSYGNKDFSKGEQFTPDEAGLKISAREQIDFLMRLWTNKLPVAPETANMTRKIVHFKDIGKTKLYGKTGSCYLHKDRQDKQLGWYVGVLETPEDSYAFATNFSDTIPSKGYAGGTARELSISILGKLGFFD